MKIKAWKCNDVAENINEDGNIVKIIQFSGMFKISKKTSMTKSKGKRSKLKVQTKPAV